MPHLPKLYWQFNEPYSHSFLGKQQPQQSCMFYYLINMSRLMFGHMNIHNKPFVFPKYVLTTCNFSHFRPFNLPNIQTLQPEIPLKEKIIIHAAQ